MDPSEITAIIALIVSLIALLITLLQLLQSSALSAEGWRRCNQTTMGRWSVFSRRKWLWSELRFEVKFTTPMIQIWDTQDFGTHELTVVTPDFDRNLLKSGKKRLFAPEVSFSRPEAKSAREAAHLLGFHTIPNSIESAWASSSEDGSLPFTDSQSASLKSKVTSTMTVLFRSYMRWLRGYHFHWHRSFNADLKIAITWDTLLMVLYQQQMKTIAKRTPDRPIFPDKGRLEGKLRQGETLVCVELERHSWDFLPPDVVRPLAVSDLKTVVILARRLGMKWRIFDRVANNYHAKGEGCSLSATSMRGLGLVFRFNSRRRRQSDQPMIWSANADKAYFGIVAGEPSLGIEDYPAVGNDRVVHADNIIREQLGELPRRMKNCGSHLGRVLLNDFVALVAPFMPLLNCQQNRIASPLPSRNPSKVVRALSLLKVFAFHDELQKELNDKVAPILKCVIKDPEWTGRFPNLEAFIEQDTFYEHLVSRGETGNLRSLAKTAREAMPARTGRYQPLKSIEDLRTVHRATTLFFSGEFRYTGDSFKQKEGVAMAQVPDDISNLIRRKGILKDCVRAHMTLVARCYFDMFHKSKSDGFKNPMSWGNAEKEYRDGMPVFQDFVQRMMKNLSVFRKDLEDQWVGYKAAFEQDKELCDKLWWVLIARGVAWSMSVQVEQPSSSSTVPSDVYHSDMMVWIE